MGSLGWGWDGWGHEQWWATASVVSSAEQNDCHASCHLPLPMFLVLIVALSHRWLVEAPHMPMEAENRYARIDDDGARGADRGSKKRSLDELVMEKDQARLKLRLMLLLWGCQPIWLTLEVLQQLRRHCKILRLHARSLEAWFLQYMLILRAFAFLSPVASSFLILHPFWTKDVHVSNAVCAVHMVSRCNRAIQDLARGIPELELDEMDHGTANSAPANSAPVGWKTNRVWENEQFWDFLGFELCNFVFECEWNSHFAWSVEKSLRQASWQNYGSLMSLKVPYHLRCLKQMHIWYVFKRLRRLECCRPLMSLGLRGAGGAYKWWRQNAVHELCKTSHLKVQTARTEGHDIIYG